MYQIALTTTAKKVIGSIDEPFLIDLVDLLFPECLASLCFQVEMRRSDTMSEREVEE
jgi:hypothetical protein